MVCAPGHVAPRRDGVTYQLDYDQTGTPISLKVQSGNRNFFVLDGQGTVVGLVKDDGTVSGTYTYDPYGNQLSATGTGEAVGINFYHHTLGFTDSDSATGWTKHGTRWNDTTTGTWTQQDQLSRLADPGNGNHYNYAGSNPINNLDPTGLLLDDLQASCEIGGLVAGLFATVVDVLGPLSLIGAFVCEEYNAVQDLQDEPDELTYAYFAYVGAGH